MAKVDIDSAKLVLMELAEAFGSDESMDDILGIAMDGRVYLSEGKAVYRFRQPIELQNGGTLAEIKMRQPSAQDFIEYSRGMVVSVSREGSTDIDMVMMAKRTMQAVGKLSEQPAGVIQRMSRRDLDDLTKIGDALGFFD